MALLIRWRLLFRVGNLAAFKKCVATTVPLLGEECKVSEGRPYWKDPELWECAAVTPTSGSRPEDQVFEALVAAKRIAPAWSIHGSLSLGCVEGFGGVFAAGNHEAGNKVPGLAWASFELISEDAEQTDAMDSR